MTNILYTYNIQFHNKAAKAVVSLIYCIDKNKNTKFTGLNISLASSMFASNNLFLILQFQTI